MQKEAPDLVKMPKYKIGQMLIEKVIPIVQKIESKDLRAVYLKICGEDSLLKLKNNSDVLRRKICYALQNQKHGGLSVRHYNLIYRLDKASEAPVMKDRFQPKPDTILTRRWQGKDHHVYVRKNGFEYEGETYPSLSKLAKVITGHERSGPVFFGLKSEGQTL